MPPADQMIYRQIELIAKFELIAKKLSDKKTSHFTQLTTSHTVFSR